MAFVSVVCGIGVSNRLPDFSSESEVVYLVVVTLRGAQTGRGVYPHRGMFIAPPAVRYRIHCGTAGFACGYDNYELSICG